MLEALRKGTGTWIAKIFIGLLVLSFAVWGIADIFGGYGRRTVATVGDAEITYEEFQNAMRLRMQTLRGQLGRSLTLEEARNFGIDQLVLRELVTEAALENQGAIMNLGISDKAIAESIVREPAFRDITGSFSRTIFEQLLQANGLSEAAYVARQRGSYVRRQLVQTVGDSVELPKVFLKAADVYRNETRRMKFITVGMDKIDPVEEPTAEALQKFYDGNKNSYSIPELRKIGVLSLLPEQVAKTINITDDELKTYYDDFTDQFRTPEKRTVQQISFSDEASAREAREKISNGSSFDELMTERNLSEEDVSLGTVEKRGMADRVIADAAFALAANQVSEPVKGALTTVLLRVTAIQFEETQPFEEAKETIRQTIALDRATNEITDLHNAVEDERAGGLGLEEVAKKLSLEFVITEPVDSQGKDADGTAISPLPEQARILREAFQSEPGVENDPVETQAHGLVWYDVIDVVPTKIRPFEEVRDRVATDWRASEERNRLAKFARELADRVKKGESLADVAEELSLEVAESAPQKRDGGTDALPRNAVAQAFALSLNGAGNASSGEGRNQVIFQVAEITAPTPPTSSANEELADSFKPQFEDDLISTYVAALAESFSVTQNQPLIDELTGRTQPAQGGRGSY